MNNTVSITENTHFKRLYYRGKPIHSQYCVLYYMPNRQNYNRLGFTVSKKIGKAVKRNTVRRRLYESFRLFEADIKSGYDIVIVAKPACLCVNFHEVKSVLEAMLKKAQLL